jgi:periplasmic divalent cation tolerance protein
MLQIRQRASGQKNLASPKSYGFVYEMKSAAKFRLILVTAPDLKTARILAQAALRNHLAACANLIPQIESHYWWQGKIERGSEVLIVIKTTIANLAKLERLILARHPYDTPEFLIVPLAAGNQRYLNWLSKSCAKFRRKKG